MKTHVVLHTLVLAVAAGAAGFGLRSLGPASTVSSARQEIPPLDYFASSGSFSEVEQTRTHLKALSSRYLYLAQVHQAEALQRCSTGPDTSALSTSQRFNPIVDDLQAGLREFRGTGEEAVLTQGLLNVLASEGDYARWTDVYLDLLYRRPTEEAVGRLASTAVAAGRAAGRLESVLEGFRHVGRIPFDFETKRRVQAVLTGVTLTQAAPQDETARRSNVHG